MILLKRYLSDQFVEKDGNQSKQLSMKNYDNVQSLYAKKNSFAFVDQLYFSQQNIGEMWFIAESFLFLCFIPEEAL